MGWLAESPMRSKRCRESVTDIASILAERRAETTIVLYPQEKVSIDARILGLVSVLKSWIKMECKTKVISFWFDGCKVISLYCRLTETRFWNVSTYKNINLTEYALYEWDKNAISFIALVTFVSLKTMRVSWTVSQKTFLRVLYLVENVFLSS